MSEPEQPSQPAVPTWALPPVVAAGVVHAPLSSPPPALPPTTGPRFSTRAVIGAMVGIVATTVFLAPAIKGAFLKQQFAGNDSTDAYYDCLQTAPSRDKSMCDVSYGDLPAADDRWMAWGTTAYVAVLVIGLVVAIVVALGMTRGRDGRPQIGRALGAVGVGLAIVLGSIVALAALVVAGGGGPFG